MKNIIYVNMPNGCACDLMSNEDTGENSVILNVTADTAKNPKLEINGTTVTITSADFEYVIPAGYYTGTGSLQFRFVDDDHTGDYFQIAKITAVSGSLFLKRISDLSYSLSCVKSSGLDKQAIVDMIYPVGSIYIGVNNASPETLFGGTWEQIKDKFLLSAGDTYSAGATGGEATHKLTTDELPAHKHSVSMGGAGQHSHSGTTANKGAHTHNVTLKYKKDATAGGSGARMVSDGTYTTGVIGTAASAGDHNHTFNTNTVANHTHSLTENSVGGNGAHNNMPPYLAVYVWKRTA